MFRKTNTPAGKSQAKPQGKSQGKSSDNRKESSPSVITRDINILGNVVSDGVIDLDGTIEGNIRCSSFTLRAHGSVKGEVVADNVFIYGKVHGLIRAKNVNLFASSRIEGIIMHESITIEDGAFIDGKMKRSDKVGTDDTFEEQPQEELQGGLKMLENIRLIS